MNERGLRTRVLFVDDEEDLLSGLRTSMRKARKRFDVEVALGGKRGLELLEERSFDIVVSDMRMPEMDGAEFLLEVSRRHPEVVRVVLSGEAGSDLLIRALHTTHQWLKKPCPADELIAALDQAVRYRAVLASDEILHIGGNVRALPTPPDLYQRVIAASASPNASVRDIAELVASDPASTAKLLQLANSAFHDGGEVHDLDSAIVLVGLDTLSRLVLAAGVLEEWSDALSIPRMPRDVCVELAQRAAKAAGSVADEEVRARAAVAALLYPVGLMAMASGVPEKLDEAVTYALSNDVDVITAGRRLHGVDHSTVAAHLLSVWGLPADIVLAVAGSHDDPVDVASSALGLNDAVRVGLRSAIAELHEALAPLYVLPEASVEVAA